MTRATLAESALFKDLTRLFMNMKNAPLAELEAAIEERFRRFVRSDAGRGVNELEITLTVTLPEGPGAWAIYGTAYRTIPAEPVEADARGDRARVGAEIIPFPDRQH